MMASRVQVVSQDTVETVESSTRVRVQDRELHLTLLMEPDELAPLFSGAAWAGTILWDAAVHLARRVLTTYRRQLEDPTNALRVLELGAGMCVISSEALVVSRKRSAESDRLLMRYRRVSGVPGMAARVAGAKHVVLTEQNELLRLLNVNVAANRAVLRLPSATAAASAAATKSDEVDRDMGAIVARPLSWGVHETMEYVAQYRDEKVDVVLSCDCIYEPLYGTSWRALAQTMELLCVANPKCVVLMCVERRNQDGVDKFLAFVANETKLTCKLDEQTTGSDNNPLEVYILGLSASA